jgi:hypothetical protein
MRAARYEGMPAERVRVMRTREDRTLDTQGGMLPREDGRIGESLTVIGPVNLTCYGFQVWGEDFLAAENAYAAGKRQGSCVAHFLCCQSVELSPKAFLSLKGIGREQLRRKPFGHNLSALFDAACRQGIGDLVTIDGNDGSVLRAATAWYDTGRGKRFQSVDLLDAMTGFRNVPDLAGLEGLATRLQASALRDAVLKA